MRRERRRIGGAVRLHAGHCAFAPRPEEALGPQGSAPRLSYRRCLEHRGPLVPSSGIVRHTLLRGSHANNQRELAHIDAGIEFDRADRFPPC